MICHIDALDECEESEIRAVIEFFEDLGCKAVSSRVRLRVCFASRHYPYISMSKCVQMILEGHPGHRKDIETYVRNNLGVLDPILQNDLTYRIASKAKGVFLWVVYAIRLINENRDRGHSQPLEAQLDVIPEVLDLLYDDMVFKRGTGDNRYFLPVLLWIAFARRPLSTKELFHAVMHTSEGKIGAAVADEKLELVQIERFILNTTKGLAEISPYTDRHVSFVHDTVRGYLQNSGISRLDSSKRKNPVGLSHDLLKTNCLEYIFLAGRTLSGLGRSTLVSDHHDKLCAMYPFLRYTLSKIVAHAELAEANGVSQKSFVKTFPLDTFISLRRIIYCFHNKCESYSSTATKTYVFARSSAPKLLQLELERTKARDKDPAHNSNQGQCGHPLHAAISKRNVDCVKLLLEHRFDPNASGLHSTALESAIRDHWNDMSILELLLQYGADPNARGETEEEDGTTVLRLAMNDGSVEVVRLLVEHGKHRADIYAKDADNMTALEYAMDRYTITNRDPIVCYLVEKGMQDAASGEWVMV